MSIGPHWESFIENAVAEGRYASASEVRRDGLRLVEEREEKQKALRETIQAAIVRGGSHSADEVQRHLEERRNARESKRA